LSAGFSPVLICLRISERRNYNLSNEQFGSVFLVFGYSFIFGFGYSLLSHAGRFTISELGDLMADRGDIFIRIVIVVGIMECVCVGLWLFHSPLNT
jgi:hypothetical protein